MSHSLLNDPRLPGLLLMVDHDIATKTQEAGCPYCGGVLHSARYPRKPRGAGTKRVAAERYWRFSFCCADEGCRRRTTPPSVRFLGRTRYASAVMVLAMAMCQGAARTSLRELEDVLAVSRTTLRRWQAWWNNALPYSPFWREAGANFLPSLDRSRLAVELVERFGAHDCLDALVRLLRFLAPLHDPGWDPSRRPQNMAHRFSVATR